SFPERILRKALDQFRLLKAGTLPRPSNQLRIYLDLRHRENIAALSFACEAASSRTSILPVIAAVISADRYSCNFSMALAIPARLWMGTRLGMSECREAKYEGLPDRFSPCLPTSGKAYC